MKSSMRNVPVLAMVPPFSEVVPLTATRKKTESALCSDVIDERSKLRTLASWNVAEVKSVSGPS